MTLLASLYLESLCPQAVLCVAAAVWVILARMARTRRWFFGFRFILCAGYIQNICVFLLNSCLSTLCSGVLTCRTSASLASELADIVEAF